MDPFSSHPLNRRHNIDSAMNSIWEFYKSNFLSLFIISLAMSLVMQYASTMINLKDLQADMDPALLLEKMKQFLVPILIISLINLLFTTILQHYIIYNPLSRQNNIFYSLIKSLKYFIPYLIIVILLAFFGSIAIILGVFALIVGAFLAGLYVMTLYLFILPIMMIEEASIGDTISRTFKLMHRNFWANLGWVAVFLIILIVISVILASLILLPFSGSFINTILHPGSGSNIVDVTNNPLFIILSALASALTLPLMPMLACVLYFNAKQSEDQYSAVPPVNQDNDKVRVEDLYAKPYSDDHPDNPERKE